MPAFRNRPCGARRHRLPPRWALLAVLILVTMGGAW